MDTPPRSTWLTFSLRELLLLLAFFAVGCAALKYANLAWELALSTIVIVLFMAATVMAVVDRGRRQAAARGLALCLAIYGVLIWTSPKDIDESLAPFIGLPTSDTLDLASRLPTSQALQPLYEAVVTRKVVPIPGSLFAGGAGGGLQVETPHRGRFMAVGHWLWALLLGYAGLRVALWCHDRREKPRPDA